MNITLLIPLLITSLITILGWYILHRLTKKREQNNKRKDLRINYLIDAWGKLEYAANRNIDDTEFVEYIEKPFASIQLFGTVNQIELTHNISDEIAKNNSASFDLILEDLRTDLRKELNLEKAPRKMKFIRFNKN